MIYMNGRISSENKKTTHINNGDKIMTDTRTFYALAVDPLHIGTGGYRLGRVDNTIVRDPGTNLPKIPGSSISGVCRNYAIYGLDGVEKEQSIDCATYKPEKNRTRSQDKIEGDEYDGSNGSSGENKIDKNNCGRCIICQAFGFASGLQKKSQIGKVKFFDAEIAAFPISTMFGPVWVTTPSILSRLGVENPPQPGDENLISTFDVNGGKLNLGWLYLDCNRLADSTVKFPGAGESAHIKAVEDKLVIAPDSLFPEIVNSNLEVRTSVSIDFETGAAEPGALFTYEAIPRAALLNFDVVVDSYRCKGDFSPENAISAEKVWEVVKSGLRLFEVMGLGGMNTRGFGRTRIVNL